jgi:hypothetical protein
VGKAITSWATIDERLFVLCWYSLGAPQQQSAIVYYKTPTLDARVTLADELIRSVFPKPERKSGGHDCVAIKEWKAIANDIRDALGQRRKIAHYPVGQVISPVFAKDKRPNFLSRDVVESGAYDVWWEFSESEGEKARTGSKESKTIEVSDLSAHLSVLSDLSSRLLGFRFSRLLSQLGSRLPPDAPPLKDLIAAMDRTAKS